MERLAELKLRFRLRFAVPIQEASWRKKLQKVFPSAQLQYSYYDASSDVTIELCHPTIFWEDPRCPAPPQKHYLSYPQARSPLAPMLPDGVSWQNGDARAAVWA